MTENLYSSIILSISLIRKNRAQISSPNLCNNYIILYIKKRINLLNTFVDQTKLDGDDSNGGDGGNSVFIVLAQE